MTWQTVDGLLVQGHQIASGLAENSPYEAGTIELQQPYFEKLGLDLTPYFAGTLNLSIAPRAFSLVQPSYTFAQVKWHPDFAPETFSFCPCKITYQTQSHDALIYYPHPETKLDHFQDPQTLEILAPSLINIRYGDRLTLQVSAKEVAIR
ncbi:MAG: hypothetical protein WBB82_14695 [Limnothrix sp.]